MYIGRIVSVVQTPEGKLGAVYRVSSRSFPNRTAVPGADKVSIIPKPGHEGDIHKNPYIAYNCVRIVCGGRVAVVTNDASLAKACGLPFGPPQGPVSHGGQRVSLYLTDRLP